MSISFSVRRVSTLPYEGPLVPAKKKNQIRNYGLAIRYYGLVIRNNGLVIRNYGLTHP